MNKNFPTKEQIGMEKISPSKLNTFEECPKLFYYECWLGIELDQDKLHMDFGTAIHEAIEQIYREYDNHFGGAWEAGVFENVEKKFLEKWTKNKVTDRAYVSYMKTNKGKESGFKNKTDLYNFFKNDGLIMLKSYWDNKENMLVQYGHDLTTFEESMKFEVCNPENKEEKLPVIISCRLDAESRDKTKIVDFKTSGSKYDAIETRKKIQGQTYCFGKLMMTGTLTKKFDYIVLRKGLKTPDRIQVVELEYDMADMNAYYHRVRSILLKIANREFDRPAVGHNYFCRCFEYEKALSIN